MGGGGGGGEKSLGEFGVAWRLGTPEKFKKSLIFPLQLPFSNFFKSLLSSSDRMAGSILKKRKAPAREELTTHSGSEDDIQRGLSVGARR